MKKIINYILPTILLIFFIATPNIVISGTKTGLYLWTNALIPALLPYMLFSNIMINSGLTLGIAKFAYPLTKALKISPNAAFGIIAGLFFGYPACAANLNLLVKNGYIDKETAAFCVCAFNNVSPSYIIAYICIGLLNNPKLIPLFLFLFYISLLLSTIIIKNLFFKNLACEKNTFSPFITAQKNPLRNAITNSSTNIILLGGYVILFSIITEYFLRIPCEGTKYIIPFVEIARGSALICNEVLPFTKLIIILLPAMSFGGISGIFQTVSVDTENFINIKKYIYSKLIASGTCLVVTALTVYVLTILN